MPQPRGLTNPYYYGRAEQIDPSYLALIQILQQMLSQTQPVSGEQGPGGGYNPFAWMDEGDLTPAQKRLADEEKRTAEALAAGMFNQGNRARQDAAKAGEMQQMMELLARLAQGGPQTPGGGPESLIEVTIPPGGTGAKSQTMFGEAGIPANMADEAMLMAGAPRPGQSQESYLTQGVQMPDQTADIGLDWGTLPEESYMTAAHEMLTGRGTGMPPVATPGAVPPVTAAADELLSGKGAPPPLSPEMKKSIDEANDLALILGVPVGELERLKASWAQYDPETMDLLLKKLRKGVVDNKSWSELFAERV